MFYSKSGGVETTQFSELDESFLFFSNEESGLNTITDQTYLEEILFSRNNVDEVIYTLKFLPDKENYERILESEASSFTKLNEQEKREVIQYASILNNVLNNTPTIYSFSELEVGEKGLFIAYIYFEKYTLAKKNQTMHIAWKADREDFRIFEKILQISEKSSEDFPQTLRMTGNISTNVNEDDIHIHFSGNSKKRENLYAYSSNLLNHFEDNIKDTFAKKKSFEGKEIQVFF